MVYNSLRNDNFSFMKNRTKRGNSKLKKIHRGSTVYWVTFISNYYLKEGNVGLNVHVNTAVF